MTTPKATPDTDTDVLAYHAAQAAVAVLMEAGCSVETSDTAVLIEQCKGIALRTPDHDSVSA